MKGHKFENVESSQGAETLDEASLASLLKETKKAHSEYEAEAGAPDEDWAGWYAHYVAEKLNGAAEESDLKRLLTEAASKYTGEDWPERYAEYIAHELGGEDEEQ